MCGIFGVVWNDREKTVDRHWVMEATDSMMHRGPDDHGIHIDGNVGFGHRRLSIIDLERGRQPVYNEDRSISIVFNGEIYNYRDLRNVLLSKGHVFQTNSDTEVIVHAYEEYGVDCSRYLRGMFAFAIHDKNKNTVYLSRDRLGIKPLYFHLNHDGLIFSSEIKALRKTGLVPSEINIQALDFYLTVGYVPSPRTLFRDINKLSPGNYLTVKDGNVEITSYWDLDNVRLFQGSFGEAKERMMELLLECVDSHLMSEVPLGVFLSGGLDSSTIVAAMSKFLNVPVSTFSVGYKDAKEICELEKARIVAETFRCDHNEFDLTSEDFIASIDQVLGYTEEPIVESSAIALYKLSVLAKTKATVLLSGEGADEVFAGYPIYKKMRSIESLKKYSGVIPKSLLHAILRSFAGQKGVKYADWLTSREDAVYQTVASDMSSTIRNRMFSDELRSCSGNEVNRFFSEQYEKMIGRTLLQKMQYMDTKIWLPDDLLLKADKMTMAASIELRVPFLDHKMVEFGFSLPDDFKMRNGTGKVLLRSVMSAHLPKKIIFGEKKGFPVPISKWFRYDIFQSAADILLDRRTISRGYFMPGYVDEILLNHKSNKEDLGKKIFSLVNLELWHRKYIDASHT